MQRCNFNCRYPCRAQAVRAVSLGSRTKNPVGCPLGKEFHSSGMHKQLANWKVLTKLLARPRARAQTRTQTEEGIEWMRLECAISVGIVQHLQQHSTTKESSGTTLEWTLVTQRLSIGIQEQSFECQLAELQQLLTFMHSGIYRSCETKIIDKQKRTRRNKFRYSRRTCLLLNYYLFT